MKNVRSIGIALGWAGALVMPVAAQAVTVLSPNKSIEFTLFFEGRLTYTVTFQGKPVIDRSPLTVLVDGVDISEGAESRRVDRQRANQTYPWRGVHSRAHNHFEGRIISLEQAKTKTAYQLEVRAFNDGIAFRHVVPGDSASRVPDEMTAFRIPAGSTVWCHDLNGHYEAVYQKKSIDEIATGEWLAPPVTFKLPGGAYGAITEAALVNYSGMALQAGGDRRLNLVLGHAHPPSYPFRLRYSNDVERLSKAAAVSGTITSPWRVVMIGSNLNALVNGDIVHNLCPPADPKFFPKGMSTAWIKPGRAVWKYLDGGPSSFDGMKEFSRLAGELGFEYHVIEGFWSRWSDDQIRELADYSRQRGVGLFLWRHSRQLRSPEAREEFFKKLHDTGVVGAKIDFFDHEHKEIVDLYIDLLRDAARHKIMVNFHGANKPTGEPRTWPNELIREGVRGMESSRLQARARHNTTLPFTRFLAGHGDYTPVHFGARRGDTTWAHQIATAAIFDEPLLTYAAHPTNLLNHPALPMIKGIPAVWDETLVLQPSEIGELAAFARRSGKDWFVAILNGEGPRKVAIPLSFLGRGGYRAMIVRDRASDAAAVEIENTVSRRNESLTIELNSGGGFIARFSPN